MFKRIKKELVIQHYFKTAEVLLLLCCYNFCVDGDVRLDDRVDHHSLTGKWTTVIDHTISQHHIFHAFV